MKKFEQISYAKTVYGQEEIDSVLKCLSESTQMGNYSRKFEKKIAIWDSLIFFSKILDYFLFNLFGKSLLIIIEKK